MLCLDDIIIGLRRMKKLPRNEQEIRDGFTVASVPAHEVNGERRKGLLLSEI